MKPRLVSADGVSVPDRLAQPRVTLHAGFSVLEGPSGSGKSTCATVLLGLLHPSSGSVTHWGADGTSPTFRSAPLSGRRGLGRAKDWCRLETKQNRAAKLYLSRDCGYVAQRPYLPPHISAHGYGEHVHQVRGNCVGGQRLLELAEEDAILNDYRNSTEPSAQRRFLRSFLFFSHGLDRTAMTPLTYAARTAIVASSRSELLTT